MAQCRKRVSNNFNDASSFLFRADAIPSDVGRSACPSANLASIALVGNTLPLSLHGSVRAVFLQNYLCPPIRFHNFQLRTRNSIRGFLRPSVHWSVRMSVCLSAWVEKWENKRFRTFLVVDSCISSPAHPSATGVRVSGLVLWFLVQSIYTIALD